jgi:protein-L-isoaspartate(D-aspartate) O-methyltransferase
LSKVSRPEDKSENMDEDSPRARVGRLILALRSQGVTDPKVLDAIEATPREIFVPELFRTAPGRTPPCPSPAARPSASPSSWA